MELLFGTLLLTWFCSVSLRGIRNLSKSDRGVTIWDFESVVPRKGLVMRNYLFLKGLYSLVWDMIMANRDSSKHYSRI